MPAVTDKQEQIMKASLELFIERGFDGTTMPMISKEQTSERAPFTVILTARRRSSIFCTSAASQHLSKK